MLNHWKSFSDRVVEENQYPISLEPKAEEIETAKRESKTIPLTVLFYEGPNSRAYLETIFSLGLRPQKIIKLISSRDIVTKKPVAPWLPFGLKRRYAEYIQTSKIHYWPKRISREHKEIYERCREAVASSFGFRGETIQEAVKLNDLSRYSNVVEKIAVENLRDRKLLDHLSSESKGTLLFTGGGIAPAKMLSIEHLKFIHIHPGYLPEIRGADCDYGHICTVDASRQVASIWPLGLIWATLYPVIGFQKLT